jgi:hypothetical protein
MNREPDKETNRYTPRPNRGAHNRTRACIKAALELLINAGQVDLEKAGMA